MNLWLQTSRRPRIWRKVNSEMNRALMDRVMPQNTPFKDGKRPHAYYYKGIEADKEIVFNHLKEECERQKRNRPGNCIISIPEIVSAMALEHSFSVKSVKQILVDLYSKAPNLVHFISASRPAIVHLWHPAQDHILLNMCIHKRTDVIHYSFISISDFEEALK